jgi:hypothetical protein
MRLPLLVALVLTLVAVAPVAAGASVERERVTHPFGCIDDVHVDPVTGAETVFSFCTGSHLVFTRVTTPSGIELFTGSVQSEGAVYEDGVLLQNDTVRDHFTNLTRQGFEQVIHKNLRSTHELATGELSRCEVRYHVANGAVIYGQEIIVCDGDDGGGGEG